MTDGAICPAVTAGMSPLHFLFVIDPLAQGGKTDKFPQQPG